MHASIRVYLIGGGRMEAKDKASRKPIGTREWYDFIGQLAEVLPGIHLGGREATRSLFEMCHLESSSVVLDVGCGGGNTACLIAQQVGAAVQGIDLSEVMIEKARLRASRLGLQDSVKFRVGDVFELPFEDNAFDVVLVESVLTTLPGDKGLALSEMVRVVRPGGWIGANESTVDPAAPESWLDLVDEHPAIHGVFTPQTLRTLFEGAGLQRVELVEVQQVETPKALQEMGLRGLLSFMFRAYPKILFRMLRDARIRRAGRIDDQITKQGKQYMGYALVAGQKPD